MYIVPNKQVNFGSIVWDSPIIILRYPQTPLPCLCGTYLTCDSNFQFIHTDLCINSTACVVSWLGQGFHKSLLGFCGLKNLGWLMVSGSTKIDGRSPLIFWLTSLTNSGAWDVAIVGNSFVSHHVAPMSFLRALPAIKSCSGGCPSVRIHFFLPITGFPGLPGTPPHQLYLGRCLSVGNASLRYFPFQIPIPATYNPSLMYPLYVCTSL